MLRKVVRARSSSLVERQRDADAPFRNSSHLHQSKIGGRSGQSAHPSNHHISTVESRAVKHGVDSSSLIPLEGSSATSAADPKVDKSTHAGDAGVSNLLKMNFLSSPSTCAKLVDQIRQAGDIDVVDQVSGAAEGVADQANTEVAADQGSPVGVSE
ncbi:unnamed protein product [Prunus brigantina]